MRHTYMIELNAGDSRFIGVGTFLCNLQIQLGTIPFGEIKAQIASNVYAFIDSAHA